MEPMPLITQDPSPGHACVMYGGDRLTIRLTLSFRSKGTAYVRTNLGAGQTSRKEIINRVEKDEIKLDGGWIDIEMAPETDLTHLIVLGLHQTGHFQAKCFFLPENSHVPLWPKGENIIINVEPAGTCCANIIYNAFVRQFGPTKNIPGDHREPTGIGKDPAGTDLSAAIEHLDNHQYTVIPESGKFRDLIKEIPFIFSKLGCRVLHLLPIHPTPTTYARMGRFGSPYAALNFTQVDPALAEFDPRATPLEQFMELVDAVHFHHGYLFMDIAINHTGWAAAIHDSHPEWLVRDEAGTIQVPGAWGVEWADLTKLDYSNTDLWKYMADIFLLWCRRGVDGFRCDAGYMIPTKAWEYIVAKVREEYPDALFLLEGLGGPVKTTRDILGRANFNWAYSELFQNYTLEQISDYLPRAYDISHTSGHLIHFAETHDNNRLAAESLAYAKMRTSLCALFSVCGGFGFANGVEWFATQKIDVHESRSLNWGSPDNQVDHIARLNRILSVHPAFFSGTRISLVNKNRSQGLVLLRHNLSFDKKVFILVNLDCDKNRDLLWPGQSGGPARFTMIDLLSGSKISVRQDQEGCRIKLSPGQVLLLSPDMDDLSLIEAPVKHHQPERVYFQKLQSKVVSILAVFRGYKNIDGIDLAGQARALAKSPLEFIRSLGPKNAENRVIPIDIDTDTNRRIMIPPRFFILVTSRHGFRAQAVLSENDSAISQGYEEGIPRLDHSSYFAVFPPKQAPDKHWQGFLNIRSLTPEGTRMKEISLLYLAPYEQISMSSVFTRKEIVANPYLKLLSTTRQGGMMRAAAWWGKLDSRYDALLAANLDRDLPENRWMTLSRYRIWTVFQGYSRELRPDCLESFVFSYDKGGLWRFHVPTSEGKYYVIQLSLTMAWDDNRVSLTISRVHEDGETGTLLEAHRPVTIIIRPDIEDRSFHDTVKAYTGPETQWPSAVTPREKGFSFAMSRNHQLRVDISDGRYVHEPEWDYMVHRPIESQRGLDADSDLFSPGYLTAACTGGQRLQIRARVTEETKTKEPDRKFKKTVKESLSVPSEFSTEMDLDQALYRSLDAFLVDRNADKSVIAGYPWFLDWGRDSLIFCRGLIELGRFSDAKAVLRLFGRFEHRGTLPNMICGKDAKNIETSDAPLWFFACCKDLIEKEGNQMFLDEETDGRSIREILISIARSLIEGTPTGVRVDPDTGLLYSPSHFTWMDTNFPAGSPRQGYPVEIQALWYNALCFLGKIDPEGKPEWKLRAETVQASIIRLFYNEKLGFFSDCLHATGTKGAEQAVPDDALRPNQLFLITLGVVTGYEMAKSCVETCLELIVPGGIRSLADRTVEYPINIFYNNRLINDPLSPYHGEYAGDEDTRRKPAYHNGTAWCWPFPVFCEAWAMVFGKTGYSTCLAWLGSVIILMRKGAAGFIPEILDGNAPHTPRGCDAQAWSMSETARVVHKLSQLKEQEQS